MIVLGIGGYNPRIWQDYVVRVLNKTDASNLDNEFRFQQFAYKLISFIDDVERRAYSEFQETIGDPYATPV